MRLHYIPILQLSAHENADIWFDVQKVVSTCPLPHNSSQQVNSSLAPNSRKKLQQSSIRFSMLANFPLVVSYLDQRDGTITR